MPETSAVTMPSEINIITILVLCCYVGCCWSQLTTAQQYQHNIFGYNISLVFATAEPTTGSRVGASQFLAEFRNIFYKFFVKLSEIGAKLWKCRLEKTQICSKISAQQVPNLVMKYCDASLNHISALNIHIASQHDRLYLA